MVKRYNTTITCEGVSVVIVLSLSLRKKGSSVFGDRGQRRSPPVKYLYNVTKLRMCNAPINVSPPPLPGEVGQSWGFDLIRIQLPHPLGNVRIQILTGHALRVFRMRTLAIQYPDPWGKPAIPNKENSPLCPGWGLTLIGA